MKLKKAFGPKQKLLELCLKKKIKPPVGTVKRGHLGPLFSKDSSSNYSLSIFSRVRPYDALKGIRHLLFTMKFHNSIHFSRYMYFILLLLGIRIYEETQRKRKNYLLILPCKTFRFSFQVVYNNMNIVFCMVFFIARRHGFFHYLILTLSYINLCSALKKIFQIISIFSRIPKQGKKKVTYHCVL